MPRSKQVEKDPRLAGLLGPFPMVTPPVAPGFFIVSVQDTEALEFWFWTGHGWTDSDDGLGSPCSTERARGWYGRFDPIRANPRGEYAWKLGARFRTADGLCTGTLAANFYTSAGSRRVVLELDAPAGGALCIFRSDEVEPVGSEEER